MADTVEHCCAVPTSGEGDKEDQQKDSTENGTWPDYDGKDEANSSSEHAPAPSDNADCSSHETAKDELPADSAANTAPEDSAAPPATATAPVTTAPISDTEQAAPPPTECPDSVPEACQSSPIPPPSSETPTVDTDVKEQRHEQADSDPSKVQAHSAGAATVSQEQAS